MITIPEGIQRNSNPWNNPSKNQWRCPGHNQGNPGGIQIRKFGEKTMEEPPEEIPGGVPEKIPKETIESIPAGVPEAPKIIPSRMSEWSLGEIVYWIFGRKTFERNSYRNPEKKFEQILEESVKESLKESPEEFMLKESWSIRGGIPERIIEVEIPGNIMGSNSTKTSWRKL